MRDSQFWESRLHPFISFHLHCHPNQIYRSFVSIQFPLNPVPSPIPHSHLDIHIEVGAFVAIIQDLKQNKKQTGYSLHTNRLPPVPTPFPSIAIATLYPALALADTTSAARIPTTAVLSAYSSLHAPILSYL